MILIADSGSTKTEWREVTDGVAGRSYISSGINPFFVTGEEIISLLRKEIPEMEGSSGKPHLFLRHRCQQSCQG